MKHLKKYENYITEELRDEEKRMILHSPLLIGGMLVGKLLNAYPLLNYRWNEIKKKTEDSSFSPILATDDRHNTTLIKDNWVEIKKEDFPKTKLKFGFLFGDWKFYSRKFEDPNLGPKNFIYISKDDIKVGDRVMGERINDTQVYTEEDFLSKRKSPKGKMIPDKLKPELPAIVICAKVDNKFTLDDYKVRIEEVILSRFEDYEYPTKKIYGNVQMDKLTYSITLNEDSEYSKKFGSDMNHLCKWLKSYLSEEGLGNFDVDFYLNFKHTIDNTNSPYYLLLKKKNNIEYENVNDIENTKIFKYLSDEKIKKWHNNQVFSSGFVGGKNARFFCIDENNIDKISKEFKIPRKELYDELVDNIGNIYPSNYNSIKSKSMNITSIVFEFFKLKD